MHLTSKKALKRLRKIKGLDLPPLEPKNHPWWALTVAIIVVLALFGAMEYWGWWVGKFSWLAIN